MCMARGIICPVFRIHDDMAAPAIGAVYASPLSDALFTFIEFGGRRPRS
jgi:hypothetical protein